MMPHRESAVGDKLRKHAGKPAADASRRLQSDGHLKVALVILCSDIVVLHALNMVARVSFVLSTEHRQITVTCRLAATESQTLRRQACAVGTSFARMFAEKTETTLTAAVERSRDGA